MVGFPLLLIPLAVYNIVVLLMRDVSLSAPVVTLPLMSGADWPISLGDILLALAALLLLLEIVKGARPGAKYLMDHLLSLIVFGAAAAEFLLLPKFGTSIFFLLCLFAMVDFLSGVRGAVQCELDAFFAHLTRRSRLCRCPRLCGCTGLGIGDTGLRSRTWLVGWCIKRLGRRLGAIKRTTSDGDHQ